MFSCTPACTECRTSHAPVPSEPVCSLHFLLSMTMPIFLHLPKDGYLLFLYQIHIKILRAAQLSKTLKLESAPRIIQLVEVMKCFPSINRALLKQILKISPIQEAIQPVKVYVPQHLEGLSQIPLPVMSSLYSYSLLHQACASMCLPHSSATTATLDPEDHIIFI